MDPDQQAHMLVLGEDVPLTTRSPGKTRDSVATRPNGHPRDDVITQFRATERPGGTRSQATRLVELAAGCELFHTADSDAYSSLRVDGHTETWPVRSKDFRRWLQHRFFLAERKTPSSQALSDALNQLDAIAVVSGPQHDVYVRIASLEGRIYLDLCDRSWRTASIGPEGWSVVAEAPVRFRRPRGSRALPEPQRGGDLNDLRRFLNVDDSGFVLACAHLIASLRPQGPFPVLQFVGEQGSGKSTNARICKQLVDPSVAPLRSEPRDVRDLMIAAGNSWVLALDNLSGIPTWLSDSICRLSTGDGFSTRELYTNTDEVLFDATRPVLLNGITDVATRSDLLDRILAIRVPGLADGQRLSERQFWRDFDELRPRILGALLEGVACALRNVGRVELHSAARMADFVEWVVAAEPALPWSPGAFVAAYSSNRHSLHEIAIDAAPVGGALLQLVEAGPFAGTASQLLDRLSRVGAGDTSRRQDWPRSAYHLSLALRRLAPNLRAVGVGIEFSRTGHARRIAVHKMGSAQERHPRHPRHDARAHEGD